jgi:hypothetical protein
MNNLAFASIIQQITHHNQLYNQIIFHNHLRA